MDVIDTISQENFGFKRKSCPTRRALDGWGCQAPMRFVWAMLAGGSLAQSAAFSGFFLHPNRILLLEFCPRPAHPQVLINPSRCLALYISTKNEHLKEENIKMSETDQKFFDAIIQKEGNFIFVAIPFSPREVWGAKPRYYVAGDINGIAVRGTLGALRQDYFLRLGAAWVRNSGIELGANVSVRLSLEGPQEANVESDIAKALSDNKKAKIFFDDLPTFYRNKFIRWIESSKRKETRAKRISEMLKLLEEGKREK